MSVPVLFLSPSCPCPGSPESPQGGFIGGHDCRQRCGVCPSVSIEAQTQSANCYFGGFRQYAAPGAPTPPLWYKRRDEIFYYDIGSWSTSQLWQCAGTVVDSEHLDGVCGTEIPGSRARIVAGPGGCFTCSSTYSRAAGKQELLGAGAEWGLVSGRPAQVANNSGSWSSAPAVVFTSCGSEMEHSATQGFSRDEYTHGATGYLSPTLQVVADQHHRGYREAGDFPGFEYEYGWEAAYSQPVSCNTLTMTLGAVTGSSEYTIHSYQATELSEPWTEEEIIAAAPKTPSSGPAAGGWQLRTAESWAWLQATCEIVANGLVAGVTYEVKPLMRESAWVAGQAYIWTDVDVEWERFTATASDAANGRRIEGPELEPVRGTRTEVTGALIRIVEVL